MASNQETYTMNFVHTRFDVARPMTEDEIFGRAPSVFATEAHQSRSHRFRPIATIEVVRALAKEGFHVASASQSLTRVPDRAPFTKHLLRLRQFDRVNKVDDVVAEMALRNANDGTAAYDLMAALHRIRCLNGLYAAMGELSSCKVRHSGDVVTKVIEGTYSVIEQSTKALEAVPAWSRHSPGARGACAPGAGRAHRAVQSRRQRCRDRRRRHHAGAAAEPAALGRSRQRPLDDLERDPGELHEGRLDLGHDPGRQDAPRDHARGQGRRPDGRPQPRAVDDVANAFAEERGVKIAA